MYCYQIIFFNFLYAQRASLLSYSKDVENLAEAEKFMLQVYTLASYFIFINRIL